MEGDRVETREEIRYRKEQEEMEAMQKEMCRPLTRADFTSQDTTQLQVDAINVLEKRIELSLFSTAYQQKIKNYYRFATLDPASPNGSVVGGRSSWK